MRLPAVDPLRPPPGPFRPGFWRSPLRGPYLTALLGLILLIGIPIVTITGLISLVAHQPQLGANSIGMNLSPLNFYVFTWPTRPVWLYAFTQGAHVAIGLALFPALLVKLWSVAPRLFEWPPIRSPAHTLERLSLLLLVGSALFEFGTGILAVNIYVPFAFIFPPAHYYGGWIFIAAFATHAALKFGTMREGLRTRRDVIAQVADAAPGGPASLTATAPAPATMSRRVLLGTLGAGSLLLFLQGAGEDLGGPFRFLSFLAPRGRAPAGPNGFPINQTAASAQITPASVGTQWRLELAGARTVQLSRAQLLAMPQHTYDLPIACVEGWSTTQRWTGVRLRDLATLAGIHGAATVQSVSIQTGDIYAVATLGPEQVADEQSLLALRVNGVDLSLDHGFPARVISPAVPGIHCTKWLSRMTFNPVHA